MNRSGVTSLHHMSSYFGEFLEVFLLFTSDRNRLDVSVFGLCPTLDQVSGFRLFTFLHIEPFVLFSWTHRNKNESVCSWKSLSSCSSCEWTNNSLCVFMLETCCWKDGPVLHFQLFASCWMKSNMSLLQAASIHLVKLPSWTPDSLFLRNFITTS